MSSTIDFGKVTVCPDGLRCYHGAECREHHQGKIFACDCLTVPEYHVFDGLSCEYKATSYCNEDDTVDTYRYCTNEGVCRQKIDSSLPYDEQLCDCPSNFSGRHCQHIVNHTQPIDLTEDSIRPDEDLTPRVGAPPIHPSESNNNGTPTGVFYAVGCLAFVGVAAALIIVGKRGRRRRTPRTRAMRILESMSSSQRTEKFEDVTIPTLPAFV